MISCVTFSYVTFSFVFLFSLAEAAGIDPTSVVFIIAAAANGGESVDVAFSLRSEGVNVKALSQIVSSDETKTKIVAALAEAGYDSSDVNGTPTVVNLSPTARPTSMPTMKLTVVRAMQRVIGATLENADYEAFRTAIEQVINNLDFLLVPHEFSSTTITRTYFMS